MKRLIFVLLLVLLAVSCTSAHELTGTWAFIDGEESVDKTDYIKIDNEGYTRFEYQGEMATGKLEKVKHGWVFHSDRGDYKISILESLYEFENGSLGVSIINEYEDIQLGYFKRIEETIE
jgi:hypothetical protein